MTIPTITTARLILRPFAEEDTDPLHQILGDRDVIRYLPTTEPPARDRVRRFGKSAATDGGRWNPVRRKR